MKANNDQNHPPPAENGAVALVLTTGLVGDERQAVTRDGMQAQLEAQLHVQGLDLYEMWPPPRELP